MPLTMKSIKGYIHHNLIDEDFEDEQSRMTYAVCYATLAEAINTVHAPEVKITRKDFKNNTLDPNYFSYCYSILTDPVFQKGLKQDVINAIQSSNDIANRMYDEIH